MKPNSLLIVLLGASLGVFSNAGATLIGDYNFDGNLSSSVGGAPDLTVFGSGTGSYSTGAAQGDLGASENVYSFSRTNGLGFNNSGGLLPGDYSVALLSEFDALTGWTRLFDPNGSANDLGLYVVGNNGGSQVYYYNFGGGGALEYLPNQYDTTVLTWNASSSQINLYTNGVHRFTSGSVPGEALGGLLTFFEDNGNNEDDPGSVARIQIYDHALTAAEVSSLDLTASAAVPSGGTTALMLGLGLLGMAGVKRKLRSA